MAIKFTLEAYITLHVTGKEIEKKKDNKNEGHTNNE